MSWDYEDEREWQKNAVKKHKAGMPMLEIPTNQCIVAIYEDELPKITDEDLAAFRMSRETFNRLFAEGKELMKDFEPSDRRRACAEEHDGEWDVIVAEYSELTDPLMLKPEGREPRPCDRSESYRMPKRRKVAGGDKMENDNGEGTIELDGKEMFVVRNGIRVAKRRRKAREWVSLMPGITVRDFTDKGREGIKIIYSGSRH